MKTAMMSMATVTAVNMPPITESIMKPITIPMAHTTGTGRTICMNMTRPC